MARPPTWTRSSAACARHGVAVIEDCSQAHGAALGGRRVGTLGDIATFSLYPTKNLGALGDGGVIATRRRGALPRASTALRQYGWRTHYISEAVGVNSRLDELQAAILRVEARRISTRRTPAAARSRPPTTRRLRGSAIAAPRRRGGPSTCSTNT